MENYISKLKYNQNFFIKLSIVVLSISLAALSSNNYINNDNYFPISYLFMLEQEEFYNSLVKFIPFEIPNFFLKILFYTFITPLSSTYAPLPYVIYPIILLFDSVETIFTFTMLLNAAINSWILIEAYNRFRAINKVNLFLVCLAMAGLGIGNLIYIGSNMPYSFIVSEVFLIVGMSIDKRNNLSRDILILTILFLLNYQIIYLMPVFFTLKSITFIKSRMKLTKSIFISFTTLAVVVFSSILFIIARGNLTGTHKNVSVNWNSGVNNEYLYDSTNKFSSEIIDLLSYLPRSILYHLNEDLYTYEFFSIIFWGFIIVIIVKDILYRKFNQINAFFYLSLLTLLFLIFLGKSVYGPTRHTLFLLPLFCLFIFNNISKFRILINFVTIIIISFFSYNNIGSILDRKNNFIHHIQNVHKFVENKPNHDILLFSCTYQPFIEKTFRKSLSNKKVLFFCGNRLQEINSNLKSNDSLLIIDATGQKQQVISKELNRRLVKTDKYSESEIKMYKEFLRLNHNMEQKDYTQLPKKTGLFIWETINKF